MLEELYIDGYRHFRNCVIPFRDIQIFVGRNGAGKTAAIELLAKLRDFLAGRDRASLQPCSVSDVCSDKDIPRWDKADYGKYTTTVGFTYTSSQHGKFEYELKMDYNFRDDANRVFEEKVSHRGTAIYESHLGDARLVTDDSKTREFPVDWYFSGLSTAKRFNSGLRTFCSEISAHIIPLSLNPHSISALHEVKSELLALSGANFSSWYDHLRDKYIKEIADVYSEYVNFIPGFERLSLEDYGSGKKLLADCHASGADMFSLSFDELSQGQKLLCVLHLLLKTAPTGSTILIDEFENYLAPSEFVPFYNSALMAASERQLQIVLVSHHQKTLNWYHDQALIFSLDSTFPSTVRVKRHDSREYPSSLAERLEFDGE